MRGTGILAAALCLVAVGLARCGDSPFPAPVALEAPRVPLDAVPAGLRPKVKLVLESPSLSVKGLPESVMSATDVYRWLLENPPIAIRLWRELGAKVSDVEEPSPGLYHWTDGLGSDIRWQTATRTPRMHVWYAEGKVKPTQLLPASAFKAVCVLHYAEDRDAEGRATIRHQAHFHVRCDGRAMALAARVLGNSAPHLGEQYLGQLQMFYGGLGWYLTQDPPRARRLLVKAGIVAAQP
jgi:hypothetical protein